MKKLNPEDLEHSYQNLMGGMLVTTFHKGSGAIHSTFVPGSFAIPVLDDDGNDTGEVQHVNGIKFIQWQTAQSVRAKAEAKRAEARAAKAAKVVKGSK